MPLSPTQRSRLAAIAKVVDERISEISKTEAHEGDCRTIIEKALVHVRHEKPKEVERAFECLYIIFSRGQRQRQWSRMLELAMFFLLDLAAVMDSIVRCQECLEQYRHMVREQKDVRLLDASLHLLNEIDNQFKDLRDSPLTSEDAVLVHALNMSENAFRKKRVKNCSSSFDDTLKLFLGPRPFGTIAQNVYCKLTERIIELCVEHKFNDKIDLIGKNFNAFCNTLFGDPSKRDENDKWAKATKEESRNTAVKRNVEMIVMVRYKFLNAAIDLGNWHVALWQVTELKDFVDKVQEAFRRHNQSLGPQERVGNPLAMKRELAATRFATIARLYAAIGQPVFHAYAALQHARFDDRLPVILSALLAILSVPHTSDALARQALNMGYDPELVLPRRFASVLSLPTLPSRSSLLSEIPPAWLERSPKALANLFAVATHTADFDPNTIHAMVDDVRHCLETSEEEGLAKYLPMVERATFETFIRNRSKLETTVAVSTLTKASYIFPQNKNWVPFVVAAGASIDCQKDVIRFPSNLNTATQLMTQLGERLGAVIAQQHKVVAVVAAPEKEIEAARLHMLQRYKLQRNRIEKANERVANERRLLIQKDEAARKATLLVEHKARDADRQRTEASLRKELQQLEQNERRKKVLKLLESKHTALKIPISVLNRRSQEDFIEELTQAVYLFRRGNEESKNDDARNANYFEKACRGAEIPKREELHAQMTEPNTKDSQERRENFLKQHREQFDALHKLKQRLEKFLPHVEAYEGVSIKNSAPAASKPTKRDDQEELLRQEKEKRELQHPSITAPPPPETQHWRRAPKS